MPINKIEGTIVNKIMINDNILELTIEFADQIQILAGQWMGFLLRDNQGNFVRPYSIADHNIFDSKTNCKFLIKILEDGRGTQIIQSLKIDEKIAINGVFGHFVLNKNDSEKVFIATGTGIAPIINMIKNDTSHKRSLFFGVQYKKDILWENTISSMPDLNYKIFLSREEVNGYEYGRIDLEKFELNNNMEFYICGAPPVVKSIREILKSKGLEKVYYEQFF